MRSYAHPHSQCEVCGDVERDVDLRYAPGEIINTIHGRTRRWTLVCSVGCWMGASLTGNPDREPGELKYNADTHETAHAKWGRHVANRRTKRRREVELVEPDDETVDDSDEPVIDVPSVDELRIEE